MQHRPGDRGFSSATAARRSRLVAFALAALTFALFAAAAPFALQPLSGLSGARFDIGFYAGALYGALAASAAVVMLLLARLRRAAGGRDAGHGQSARPETTIHASPAGARTSAEFVAAVAHELRTPLTSVAGSLGLLTGSGLGRLPAPAMRLIRIAHTNCQRLVRLANDVLDIEKLESGQAAFAFTRLALKPLVEQAIAETGAMAASFGVTVTLERADNVAVSADAGRLTQALVNLLSNAIKFSPPDQKVMVSIEARGDHVRIAVADHGPGIPEGFKARVFEAMPPVAAAGERVNGGTGLGLSVVKQIVVRHDGDVGCEDVPGGGALFYLDLPTFDARLSRADPQPGGTPVLVCEDETDAAEILCEHLRRNGFAPDVAGTAGAAERAAARKLYAAILVDLRLPDGDGITLIQRLRAQWRYRNTPIVVVSATPEIGAQDARAASLRVLEWMGKPVDFDRLNRLLP
jgi:signal transduction histidine kinase/CheY-like chemotaxis protein